MGNKTVCGYTMQKIAEKSHARNMSGGEYIDYLIAKRKNRRAKGKAKKD